MIETLQEKTYRISKQIWIGEDIGTFEDAIQNTDFSKVCQFVAAVQVETLCEAVRLHAFASFEFGQVVSVEDLLSMANDIEAGL